MSLQWAFHPAGETSHFGSDSLSISVSEVVGENGSGKSSILDMMVRVLNNVATALMGEKLQYAAAKHVHYIEHVYGSVLFVQNEELRRLDVKSRLVEMVGYYIHLSPFIGWLRIGNVTVS